VTGALAILGLLWLLPQDPFAVQRDAAAALNPLSPRFTIATEGDRRAFRIGERIPIVFAYDDVRNRSFLRGLPYTHFATAVLDRREGTADPRADYLHSGLYVDGGVCGCIEGGVVGGLPGIGGIGYDAEGRPFLIQIPPPAPPKPPPLKMTFVLNEGVRFDTPGQYRFYLSDHHDDEYQQSGAGKAAPIISNIVEIEITARNQAWEDATARAAAAILDSSSVPEERTEAIDTLRFLGSGRAVDEMAGRLSRDGDRREGYQLERGLFAARDRSRVVARLEAKLDDPSRPLTGPQIRRLAVLKLSAPSGTPYTPAQKRAEVGNYARRRLVVLRRAGRLAEALDGELAAASAQTDFEVATAETWRGAGLSPALADFSAGAEAALRRLAPPAQRAVLLNRWRDFSDPRFVPMFDRLARTRGPADGPSGTAVRLLDELSPARARRLVLEDLASARPRISIEGSRILREEFLPSFDRILLTQLRTAGSPGEFAAALDRIERYATATIAADVKTLYAKRAQPLVCADVIPALAYFFRTDPAFAREQHRRIWTLLNQRNTRCQADAATGLLSLVAERRMTNGLEEAAVAALDDQDVALTADAAAMLSTYGSSRAEDALWRAFETWHRRWIPTVPQFSVPPFPWEWKPDGSPGANLDTQWATALWEGVSWRLDDADYDRMASLCLSESCRHGAASARSDQQRPQIMGLGPARQTRQPGYLVGLTRVIAISQLETKVQQFPSGTTFTWYATSNLGDEEWLPEERAAEFVDIQRLLARHGMSLIHLNR
jgi:hypothetical protein